VLPHAGPLVTSASVQVPLPVVGLGTSVLEWVPLRVGMVATSLLWLGASLPLGLLLAVSPWLLVPPLPLTEALGGM
jgi:hypothetical protein